MATFLSIFLVNEVRREDSNDTKSGPSQVVHTCIMYSTKIQAESLIPSHARIQKVLSEGVKVWQRFCPFFMLMR